MPPRPILTVVCGHAPDDITKIHGDYIEWFRQTMDHRVRLDSWHLFEGDPEPKLVDYAGVLITGSPASLTSPEPWMEVAVETIREAAEMGVPVLGVCFGHQLVGCAYGAPTIEAPEGGEHGTFPIRISDHGCDDALFAGLGSTIAVNLSHNDQVDPSAVAYSNGLRVLASSENTPVQALAAGDSVRSVQFHPEFTGTIMRQYNARAGRSTEGVQHCADAESIFANWITGWVEKS